MAGSKFAINRSFARLWRAMFVSSTGDWVGVLALAALVARLGGATGAAWSVAAVMIARLTAVVVFGPFAGVVVDRSDRKRLMVRVDLARGALYALLPLVHAVWVIVLIAAVIEALTLLWGPARDASLPHLVPADRLADANALDLATAYGTLPLGAGLFTVLVALSQRLTGSPETLALWFDACSFGVAAVIVRHISFPGARQPADRAVRGDPVGRAVSDVIAGWRTLFGDPVLRTVFLGISAAFVALGAVSALGPVFARYVLGAGDTGFGLLVTALGIGMLVGVVIARTWLKHARQSALFGGALLIAGLSTAALAAAPDLTVATLVAACVGASGAVAWVSGYTALQVRADDAVRGRVFATLTVSSRFVLLASRAAFPAATALVADVGAQTSASARAATRMGIASAAVLVSLVATHVYFALRRSNVDT